MQTADVQNDVLNLDTYKRTMASNDASDIDNIQKGTFDYINWGLWNKPGLCWKDRFISDLTFPPLLILNLCCFNLIGSYFIVGIQLHVSSAIKLWRNCDLKIFWPVSRTFLLLYLLKTNLRWRYRFRVECDCAKLWIFTVIFSITLIV